MNIQKHIDDYTSWLRSETAFDNIGEYHEITTPYLDNANDYLQIYVKQDGNDIFFTYQYFQQETPKVSHILHYKCANGFL